MNPTNKLIGLSFSGCVLQIARGEVDIENVERIIAATRCSTPEEWEFVIKEYKEHCWNGWDDTEEEVIADKAEKISRKLLAEGRVEQPRLTEDRVATSSLKNGGVWVTSLDDIYWNDRAWRF